MSTLSAKTRMHVYLRDDFRCQLCDLDMKIPEQCKHLSIDHITPVSRGGNHDVDNLQTCCKSCNSKKKNMTSDEYAAHLEKKYNQMFFDLVITDYQKFIDSGGNHFKYKVSVHDLIRNIKD